MFFSSSKKLRTSCWFFIANVLCTPFALQAQVLNPQPPPGNVALTTGTPSGSEDYGFFKF
jgi:hypothetical protein